MVSVTATHQFGPGSNPTAIKEFYFIFIWLTRRVPWIKKKFEWPMKVKSHWLIIRKNLDVLQLCCTRPFSVTWPPSSSRWRRPRPSITKCSTTSASSWNSTKYLAPSPNGSWITSSPPGQCPRASILVWYVTPSNNR